MDWWAFCFAVALCLTMVVAEGALSAKDLPQWLASLKKPRFYAPMWVWIVVAMMTYAIQGIIAYRLVEPPINVASGIALAALISVMCANVAYNVVLARKRRPRLAYTGVLWFLPPLAVLQVALLVADPVSAALNVIYVAWVVGYDVPIMRALWKLNA